VVREAGLAAGYVDLGQIGFIRPAAAGDPGSQRLKARNPWPSTPLAGPRMSQPT
jgi:hypothetical protein